MYNDAKKASNSKYLSKFKPISLRVKPEEAEQITAAAAEAGESAHAFILKAVRQRISGEHDSMRQAPDVATGESDKEALPDLLTPYARQIAQDASQAAGVPVESWIERTVQAKALAEADGRRFMAEVAARKEKEKGG